jgi:thiamine pyrophosphate-dependent acetolactate synthase large subunit-like protein
MARNTVDMRRMNRLDLSRRIVGLVEDDVLLVAGIGNAGFDLFSAGHRPGNFYMLGSMGLAVPIGLGLALAQPERSVIVMEGEGSILMNLGALATVGREAPPNLTIVVWDNAQWQLTGGQQTATGSTTDLMAVAEACGFGSASAPEDEDDFEQRVRYALDAPGPHAIVAHIDAEPAPGRHHDDPVFIKYEFMRSMGIHPD